MFANLWYDMSKRFRSLEGRRAADNFRRGFRQIILSLRSWEEKFSDKSLFEKEISFDSLRLDIYSDPNVSFSLCPEPERMLFSRLLDFFALNNSIGPTNEILRKELEERNEGKFISFLGPLGVGKSTISKVLIDDLRADFVIREPYTDNPFWGKSQTDGSYMFRSQVYFIFSNIIADIGARLHKGRSVSDTSALTDSLMWVEWYRQTGHLNSEEYNLYQKLIDLLQTVIPRPDLLVALVPDDIRHLKKGIINRQVIEPVRVGELVFTSQESKDLAKQAEIVRGLIDSIPRQWQLPVLAITINPLEIYLKPSINYDYVYQIRSKLSLLGELLKPKPEIVVNKIRNILSEATEGQVIIIHAKSMFTGKTTVLCQLAEKVGSEKIVAFQPRAAVRWSGQKTAIVSRDGSQVKAKIIENNSLRSIIEFVKQKRIFPKETPYLLIDEIMLFTKKYKDHEEAVKVLEELRTLGFHVIVDGIDYTFQEKPFTFMHRLLRETRRKDGSWHAIEMSTRCRYCDKDAVGTRRIKESQIANYSDTVYLTGDKDQYEPVCCQVHKSCEGQPSDFIRKELPV